MATDQPSGEVPATIDASGGQGVVVGDGNVQYNYLSPSPALSPAAMAGLAPQAAAARIRQLSHDAAVDFFASAPPEVLQALAGKLKPLLVADEDKARIIAVLADLERPRAAVLITPYADTHPLLTHLPEAAEAIAHRAERLEWDRQPGRSTLELAPRSPSGTEGYVRHYQQGRVYWADGDIHVVRGR
jgi:hypothetical protein